MKRKIVSVLMASVMAAALLTGCGGNSNSPSGTDSQGNDEAASGEEADSAGGETGSDDGQVLTIVYNDSNDNGDSSPVYQWITQTYENWEKKDEVKLDIQALVATDSDYVTKIQTLVQDDSTCPDLFLEDTFQLNTDVAAGYVADITDKVAGWDDWNSSIIDALKEATSGTDGNTYAVPISTDVRGLWYNKDVFETAGLGREWQPESWQDILDACAAIKEKCADDVVPIWFACNSGEAEATSMNTFQMLLAGTGDSLCDDATGVYNLSSDGVKDSLGFIKTCLDEGYLGTLSEILDPSDYTYANQYMSTAKLGMYLNGSWGFNDYLQDSGYPMQGYTDDTLSDALGFAQMPTQEKGGYVTMSGGWSWAIANNSDQKDLSFEFITELMKSDNYVVYIDGTGNLATRNDMMSYDEYSSRMYIEEATAMSENAFFRPHDENYSKVSSYLYEMVDTVIRNNTDTEAALSDFKTGAATAIGEDLIQ